MHLHCHLKECVLDYGPLHAFWCFSFKRFNGILEAIQVNGRSVEVQLMRKLLAGRFVWDVEFPSEFRDHFMPHFVQEKTDLFEGFIVKNATKLFKCACCLNLEERHWSDVTLVNFSNSFKHFSLDDDGLKLLLEGYKALYQDKEIELPSSIVRKYSNVMLGTENRWKVWFKDGLS